MINIILYENNVKVEKNLMKFDLRSLILLNLVFLMIFFKYSFAIITYTLDFRIKDNKKVCTIFIRPQLLRCTRLQINFPFFITDVCQGIRACIRNFKRNQFNGAYHRKVEIKVKALVKFYKPINPLGFPGCKELSRDCIDSLN